MGFVSDLCEGVARRAREMSNLGTASDVVFATYDAVLRYAARIGLPMPFRGRVYQIGTKQVGNMRPAVRVYARLGFADGSVFEDIFVRRLYDAFDPKSLGPVNQIVDLGANVGMTLKLWSSLFPTARIAAVEPDPANMQICERNAGPDRHRVQLFQACIAAHPREVTLDRTGVNTSFRMVSPDNAPNNAPNNAHGNAHNNAPGERVPAITIPQLLQAASMPGQIDFLKCDIEGAEEELFADCSPWIAQVRHMLVELHHPYTTEAFLQALQRNGATHQVTHSSGTSWYPVLFLSRPD